MISVSCQKGGFLPPDHSLHQKKRIIFGGVDGLKLEEIKTKPFAAFLQKLGVEGKALVITENVDEKVVKSARNIEGVKTTTATIISPYMILTNGKLVLDKAALAKIEEVFA